MLGDLIVPDGLGGQVLAEARLLKAAVWRIRGQWNLVINPHGAKFKLGRQLYGAARVLFRGVEYFGHLFTIARFSIAIFFPPLLSAH